MTPNPTLEPFAPGPPRPSLCKRCDRFEVCAACRPAPALAARPWPVHEIVAHLERAATILLDGLDYDGDGWEQLHEARAAARRYLGAYP